MTSAISLSMAVERRLEFLQIGLVVHGIGGIALRQIGGERLGDRRQRRRVVPEMRIVARLLADQVGGNDGRAVRLGRCREQLVHPRIVVGAVVDDDLGIGDGARRRRAGLEEMRIVVGIGKDAGDGDMAAADLAGEVAIEILGRHDVQLVFGPGSSAGQQRRCDQQRGQKGNGTHPWSPLEVWGKARAAAGLLVSCNCITVTI